jgi:hypothetical protein
MLEGRLFTGVQAGQFVGNFVDADVCKVNVGPSDVTRQVDAV